MFNIDPSPTFTVAVPLSRPGLAQPLEVQVTFRHKNRIQAAAWVLAASMAEAKDDEDQLLNLLAEVVADWSGVLDAEGNAMAYSASALARLLTNYTPARGELYRAYITELTAAKKKI